MGLTYCSTVYDTPGFNISTLGDSAGISYRQQTKVQILTLRRPKMRMSEKCHNSDNYLASRRADGGKNSNLPIPYVLYFVVVINYYFTGTCCTTPACVILAIERVLFHLLFLWLGFKQTMPIALRIL